MLLNKTSNSGMRSECDGQNTNEMPLSFVFQGWGLREHCLYWGFGRWCFFIGNLSPDLQLQLPADYYLLTLKSQWFTVWNSTSPKCMMY